MQRRDFLKKIGTTVAVAGVFPLVSFAKSGAQGADMHMDFATASNSITGGKTPKESSLIKLKAPNIAENGAVVPITVEVNHPMTENNYVKAIHILNTKNGNTRTLDAFFTPANGKAMLSTRIKLGGTQDVVTIVELSNGEFLIKKQNVKVTIGGCG